MVVISNRILFIDLCLTPLLLLKKKKLCLTIEYTANGLKQISSDGWCALLCLVLHVLWKKALIGYYNALKCSCAGILACLDGYMNIAMEQTLVYRKQWYGDAFILRNNGTLKDDLLFYYNYLIFFPHINDWVISFMQFSTLVHQRGYWQMGLLMFIK